MHTRTTYAPGVTTIRDDDTGEVLVFALWGELEHVKLYDLVRPSTKRNPFVIDYVRDATAFQRARD